MKHPFIRNSLIACAICLFIAVLTPQFSSNSSAYGLRHELDTFNQVLGLIQTSYVEEVSLQRLLSGALSGMVKTLDPYSQYLDAHAYEDLRSETEGAFGGIGLEVSVKGGVLHVISPLDGSPAQSAGIRPGDVITKIDRIVAKDMNLVEAVRRMRGKPGTAVLLTLIHEGEKDPVDIVVMRDQLKVRGVRESKVLEGGIGYIRVSEFQEQTGKDFKDALEELSKQNIHSLIIDVRNNPGGLLSAAVQVTENFVPEGQLIVETKGRLAKKNVKFVSHNKTPQAWRPIYLLVNRGSASASEILAGALQDHKLGTVLGTKTYGKGCVQTLTPLAHGTAVRITTSLYYTPNGRRIHEIGITPDVIVKDNSKEGKDLQLEKALELIKSESTHA